ELGDSWPLSHLVHLYQHDGVLVGRETTIGNDTASLPKVKMLDLVSGINLPAAQQALAEREQRFAIGGEPEPTDRVSMPQPQRAKPRHSAVRQRFVEAIAFDFR